MVWTESYQEDQFVNSYTHRVNVWVPNVLARDRGGRVQGAGGSGGGHAAADQQPEAVAAEGEPRDESRRHHQISE